MKYKLNKKRLEYAKFLNLRLPHAESYLVNIFLRHVKRWLAIDRKQDKSYSAYDFRFWLYLRLLDEKYPII